jgi:E3 ubiquitin-protein ligase listerin
LLRRLSAVAPDPDSDVVFLPQQRAVNFVKACQGWIASDMDIDEDVESEITNVFFHLVPILQNVSGSHWDFIFDLIENNLEVC